MKIYKKAIFPLLLSTSILSACGGSSSSSTTSTNPPPNTKPTENVLKKELQYGTFQITNSGISSINNLDVTPLFEKSIIDFEANNNDVWQLSINTPSIEGEAHINPLTTFNLAIDPKYPSKITSLSLNTNEVYLFCEKNCSETYQYMLTKEKNGKTYFILNANGKALGSNRNEQKNTFSENSKILGQIKIEIDPNWPVFQTKDRFHKLSVIKNDLAINDQNINLKAINDPRPYFSDPNRLQILFELNNKIQEIDFGNKNLFYNTDYLQEGYDFTNIYEAWWGIDHIFKNNEDTGIQSLNIIKNIFNAPFGYIEGPELKLSGSFEQEIPYGKVITNTNEVFTTIDTNLYTKNQYKFFHFRNEILGTDLNVRLDTITQKINLAYQSPKKGQININLFEKWNCKTVNDDCSGITIDEKKGTIQFDNVVLEDGRKLNGELKNVGIPALPRY